MDRRNPTAAKNASETDIRDAQAGQRDTLRNLVLRYQDLAVGYAFSLLGDYHLAEDAAQEALIAMVRSLGQLREPAAFVGWLRTIVFKQCDRIRRRRRTVEPVFPDDDRLVEDTESPDQARAIDELGAHVQRAVATLPVAQREAVNGIEVCGDAGKLLPILFPLQYPQMEKPGVMTRSADPFESVRLERSGARGNPRPRRGEEATHTDLREPPHVVVHRQGSRRPTRRDDTT